MTSVFGLFLSKESGLQAVEWSALPDQSTRCSVLWCSRASRSLTWTLRKKWRLRTSAQMPRLHQSKVQEWMSCWREPDVSSPRYPYFLVIAGNPYSLYQQSNTGSATVFGCGSLLKSTTKNKSLLTWNVEKDVSLRLHLWQMCCLKTSKSCFLFFTLSLCTLVENIIENYVFTIFSES